MLFIDIDENGIITEEPVFIESKTIVGPSETPTEEIFCNKILKKASAILQKMDDTFAELMNPTC